MLTNEEYDNDISEYTKGTKNYRKLDNTDTFVKFVLEEDINKERDLFINPT